MIELKKKNSPYRIGGGRGDKIKLIINTANCLLNQIVPTWTNKGSHGMDNTHTKKVFQNILSYSINEGKIGSLMEKHS